MMYNGHLAVSSADVAALIQSNAFSMRALSWIARKDGLFFKIPRQSSDLLADSRSAGCLAEIRKEFELLALLADLSDRVIRPIACVDEYSCLVLPNLNTDDLRHVILSPPSSPGRALGGLEPRTPVDRAELLRGAVGLIATIHRNGVPLPAALGRIDYGCNRWLPAPFHIASSEERVVVVDGYEIRNLILERPSGDIYLVDPHHVGLGFPEEDVTRLIVSLLMLNWGRHFNCTVWTEFDPADLIHEYEKESGRRLDHERLAYCFQMIVGMRFYHSSRSLKALQNPLMRLFGKAYQRGFFLQIQRWSKKHDFQL